MLNKKRSHFERKIAEIKKKLETSNRNIILFENFITQKRLIYNFLFTIILCIFFVVILFLNIKTPLIGDDYVYSFLYQTEQRLTSITDVFYSQYLHYYKWGGRSVVHLITQSLLLTDNSLTIDIINSLGFIGFILVLHYHIVGKLKTNISTLIISFSLIWLLQPVFAETILWITGSSNYLWGTLLILLFLLPYRLYRKKEKSILKNIFFALCMFTGGLIAGWTNENTAAAMIFIVICVIAYHKVENKTTSAWMYTGLMGAILGYIIMIAAPGNFVRAEGTSISPFLITYRILTYTQRFIIYLGLLNLAIALMMIAYLKINSKNKKHTLSIIGIYFVGIFISIYIMVASPGFPARAWFGTITFNIIIFGILYHKISYPHPIIRQMKYCFLLFCIISVSASFYDAYKDVNAINDIWKERMIIISEKKKENNTLVIFKEYQARTKFGLGDAPYALPYTSLYYNIDIKLEK